MKDILAIVGSHPNAKIFDFERQDCDIIVFNEALKMDWIKRADYVIQIHLPAIFRNPHNRNDPNHYEWLKSGNTPVVLMQDKYPDIPRSERYPLDEICEMFPNFDKIRHFTSSISYCLAWGIWRGYKQIELYGIELETDTEYRYQQPCAMFWQGVAVGRSIRLIANTRMFDAPLYGYQGEAEIKYTEFDARAEILRPHLLAAQTEYQRILDEANKKLADFKISGNGADEIPDLIKRQATVIGALAMYDGAIQENTRYKQKADAMIEAAEDFKFSRQEFEQSAQRHAQEHQNKSASMNAAAGACQVFFEQAKNEKNQARRKRHFERFMNALQQYMGEAVKAGLHHGALMENREYMGKLDALIKAAGGAKSEQVLLNHKE